MYRSVNGEEKDLIAYTAKKLLSVCVCVYAMACHTWDQWFYSIIYVCHTSCINLES